MKRKMFIKMCMAVLAAAMVPLAMPIACIAEEAMYTAEPTDSENLAESAVYTAGAVEDGDPAASGIAREADNVIRNMDSTAKAPNVTSEMCEVSFWQRKQSCSDEVLMTGDEIAEFNRRILATEGTHTNDLSAFDGTYDGVRLAELSADFESPDGLYINGEPVPESYYEAIRENIKNAPVTEEMPYRFGFAVNRTIMKAYPYEDYLSDNPDDPEWDELVSTGILVNEPLVILFPSADGKFTLVYSQCYSGWAPTEDIAVCESKEEWESYLNPKEFLVVTDEKVYLEPSADKDLDEKLLTMGTILPLDTEHTGSVAYRMPWNNYVIKIPARDEDGRFYQKDALVSANRGVNVGYLPYTSANVLSQAFKSLGDRYGWGGMMHAQDCSAYVREVYRCFGFELARDTSWQAAMPAEVTELSEMSAEEKKEVLDMLPAGAILLIPGHEMLYLGEEDGLYYVINDAGSLALPDKPDEIIRPMGIIINDLSILRSNGLTWFENLSYAIIMK